MARLERRDLKWVRELRQYLYGTVQLQVCQALVQKGSVRVRGQALTRDKGSNLLTHMQRPLDHLYSASRARALKCESRADLTPCFRGTKRQTGPQVCSAGIRDGERADSITGRVRRVDGQPGREEGIFGGMTRTRKQTLSIRILAGLFSTTCIRSMDTKAQNSLCHFLTYQCDSCRTTNTYSQSGEKFPFLFLLSQILLGPPN